MKQMKAYINGLGLVSPQAMGDVTKYLAKGTSDEEPMLQIDKPNYKDYIHPKQLRRMSKVVRMGMVGAKIAMEKAAIEQPDSIITATGMGCQADTEKFLNAMLNNNEGLLNPTAFIQSTHNTIGAQIALHLGNHNYNFTYVHRTFSFESALLDAIMQLYEQTAMHILVGGIDEITEESWKIKTQIDYYKKAGVSATAFLEDQQPGAVAGEGSAFFMLSSEKNNTTLAVLEAVDTFFNSESQEETENRIKHFLAENELSADEVDLVLLGNNGDAVYDAIYEQMAETLFSNTPTTTFKQYCGEYDTAASFGMGLASMLLHTQQFPKDLLQNGKTHLPLKHILIYNQFRNTNHSLILLKA